MPGTIGETILLLYWQRCTYNITYLGGTYNFVKHALFHIFSSWSHTTKAVKRGLLPLKLVTIRLVTRSSHHLGTKCLDQLFSKSKQTLITVSSMQCYQVLCYLAWGIALPSAGHLMLRTFMNYASLCWQRHTCNVVQLNWTYFFVKHALFNIDNGVWQILLLIEPSIC